MVRRHGITFHLLLGLSLILPQPLAPAVIVVDGTTCDLVHAIEAANTDLEQGGCPAGSGADTLRLTADADLTAVHSIEDGPNGLPSVISEITVEGNNFDISRTGPGAPDFRIFRVGEEGNLTLEDVSVTHGVAVASFPIGGGILNWEGTLALFNTTVSSNQAHTGGGGLANAFGDARIYSSLITDNEAGDDSVDRAFGGGVQSIGYLRIEDSVISNNYVRATDSARGGGMHAGDIVLLVNSTVSGNVAVAEVAAGGGVWTYTVNLLSRIRNTTFSGNSAVNGMGGALSGNIQVEHSTFYGNTAYAYASLYGDDAIWVTGSIFAGGSTDHCDSVFDWGGNLADAGDKSCGSDVGELTGLDPVLADNGGPTLTHALLEDSSAIDNAGDCALLDPVFAFDQRGAPRFDGACDSGAFEYGGCPLLELMDDACTTIETYEECEIRVGPNFWVGPFGELTLTGGRVVALFNGFEVLSDGTLTLGTDPQLQITSAVRAAIQSNEGGEQ